MHFPLVKNQRFHVEEVADLRAAGLNPILSGTGGRGASSPGGAMPNIQDIVTPALSSAFQASRLTQELKNLRETNKNLMADTDKKTEEAALSRAATEKTRQEKTNLEKVQTVLSADAAGAEHVEKIYKDEDVGALAKLLMIIFGRR